MTTRKLGRQARSFNPTVPHMRAMRGTQQAPLPAALSWLHGMPADLGMMLNGPTPGDPAALQLGDCVPEGVIVAGGATDRVYRGVYDGPIIAISTASGKKLPVTPNHAVLTKRGFVRACDLKKGDNLIGTPRPEVFPGTSFLFGKTNVNDSPSSVEEVFSSFALGRRSIRKVVPHSIDFHGDEKFINGNIDIVGSDGFLRGYRNAALHEPYAQNEIGAAGKLQRAFERFCAALLAHFGSWPASLGGVGFQSPEFAFGLAQGFVPEQSGVSDISRSMAGTFNRHFKSASVYSGLFAKRHDRLTGDVTADNFAEISVAVPRTNLVARRFGSDFYASSQQPSGDGHATDTELSGQLLHAMPELVEADQLVDIDFQTFKGHVYDLSTESRLYSANGLLVHNCTCAGLAHARQVWSYNASGQMVTLPDDYVLQLYEQGCGYMLGNEATDQGGNEQSLLTFCQQTGIPTPGGPDKILGFVELNVANTDDIKRAIAEGGIVYLGINIPEAWCEAPVGSTWDVTDSPTAGGHAIIGAAYDPQELYVVSWGNTWPMTWAAFAQVCDEAYLVVDQAWLNAKGSTPFGMSLDALEAAMSALKA
jgi:hypothetical protein